MTKAGFGDTTKTELILCDVCNGTGKNHVLLIYDGDARECFTCKGKGRLYKHIHVYYSNLED